MTNRERSDDSSDRAFERLETETRRRRPAANQIGILVAAAFLIATLVLLLAIEQGANLRQLLIGGLAVLVVNLLVAIVWATITSRNG